MYNYHPDIQDGVTPPACRDHHRNHPASNIATLCVRSNFTSSHHFIRRLRLSTLGTCSFLQYPPLEGKIRPCCALMKLGILLVERSFRLKCDDDINCQERERNCGFDVVSESP